MWFPASLSTHPVVCENAPGGDYSTQPWLVKTLFMLKHTPSLFAPWIRNILSLSMNLHLLFSKCTGRIWIRSKTTRTLFEKEVFNPVYSLFYLKLNSTFQYKTNISCLLHGRDKALRPPVWLLCSQRRGRGKGMFCLSLPTPLPSPPWGSAV